MAHLHPVDALCDCDPPRACNRAARPREEQGTASRLTTATRSLSPTHHASEASAFVCNYDTLPQQSLKRRPMAPWMMLKRRRSSLSAN
eukprot:14999576-Alexandrium_andersonii.AAC.1